MGPASLQEEREPETKSKEEMESYRCLLQAGSQLESTLQREYTGDLRGSIQALSVLYCLCCDTGPQFTLLLSARCSSLRRSVAELHSV